MLSIKLDNPVQSTYGLALLQFKVLAVAAAISAYSSYTGECRLEVAVFEGGGSLWPSFQVEEGVPTNHIAQMDRPVNALHTLPLKAFTQRNFVADFLREKPNFLYGKWKNCF